MSSFLEKHARHLNADELRDYAHLQGMPPFLEDCLSAFEKSFLTQEQEFEEELGERDERSKEELREELSTLEENLFQLIRTASYEELEEKIAAELSRFRLMMQIKEE